MKRQNKIGGMIKKYREGRGETQEQFGKQFGVGKGDVCAWELGKALPDPKHIPLMAKLLGIPVEDLKHAMLTENLKKKGVNIDHYREYLNRGLTA